MSLVEKVVAVTGCSTTAAGFALFGANGSVDHAVELILFGAIMEPPKKKQKLTSEQEEIARIREVMKRMDDMTLTSLSRPAGGGSDVTLRPHEQTVPQNSYSPQCPPSSPEVKAQTQGTVYQ